MEVLLIIAGVIICYLLYKNDQLVEQHKKQCASLEQQLREQFSMGASDCIEKGIQTARTQVAIQKVLAYMCTLCYYDIDKKGFEQAIVEWVFEAGRTVLTILHPKGKGYEEWIDEIDDFRAIYPNFVFSSNTVDSRNLDKNGNMNSELVVKDIAKFILAIWADMLENMQPGISQRKPKATREIKAQLTAKPHDTRKKKEDKMTTEGRRPKNSARIKRGQNKKASSLQK